METTSSFSGKHILVTGATSGLGLDMSNRLADHGATLSITGRNAEKLGQLADTFRNKNAHFNKAIQADLTNVADIGVLADSIDSLDGLVLNAGMIDYTPAKMISAEKMRTVLMINFESNVLIIQQLLKKKKITPKASIVFISSIAAQSGVPGTALYAASKGALNSYAKVLASELASQKIRVNVVSPGIVQTGLVDRENVTTSEQFAKLEARYPLGFGKPADVSSAVLFLLSNEAGWITGSNIVIDGGHTLQ